MSVYKCLNCGEETICTPECERLRVAIAEATALLRAYHAIRERQPNELTFATEIFLFRAPAQPDAPSRFQGQPPFDQHPKPAAPTPLDDPSLWPFTVPRAAPEPSAEPHGTGISCVDAEKGALRLAEGFAEQRDRAETAESKLAAVQRAIKRWSAFGIAGDRMRQIQAILTPAGPNGGET